MPRSSAQAVRDLQAKHLRRIAVVGDVVAVGAQADQPPQDLSLDGVVVGPPFMSLQPASGFAVPEGTAHLTATTYSIDNHPSKPLPISRGHA